VPPFVLTVLKVVFLAMLYFFIYRAVRSSWLDLRGPGPPVQRSEAGPAVQGRQAKSGGGKVPRMVVVRDENGDKAGTYRLEGQLQIGRADGCHIRLSDSYVSQFHARIFGRDGGWYVEDLGSTNGTYLNQRRVSGTPSELRAGDRVKLGKSILELKR
jgi:FHA domain-containing protein